ncbi:MAG: 4-(cytidine 5'-diphospho)-2-C-methyl-D-erythritol kinase [Desulfobulbus sp.]|jgi:4-diphosphocytidyl-2-C-methyl-D-erythritol kinase|uniref:4-(cytidine 5'-diphospho)-2-C-methyl-D-erythritol kinase n=1 Tax=Desulfobulbus sp. TaxID=895 RepID=UPI00284540CD|nr:4-(cytidine 5'-diphospho)-2-C-methyl-D-erythritol kinase [Desulfobulbus sp.]MDR2550820.1 4-(cytidine 5'-diphospho)-2-C-methyl-D-erythritol kinase [Desulfobulbus sp.]
MQPGRVTVRAPAKINLFLRIIGRRPDGYHLLSTWMQKVDLCDTIELAVCGEDIRFSCTGDGVPGDHDNLVYRAADLYLQAVRGRQAVSASGVAIELSKYIPVAAGLGGGSSDAAATLRAMNELFGSALAPDELAALGLRLGADVPFFLADCPAALATGIGEILQPVPSLQGYSVVLVNPGFPVSTRWVYQTFALTKKEDASNLANLQECVVDDVRFGDSGAMIQPDAPLVNDLETVTVARYPLLERLKGELLRHGAVQALMSGSGPTVFGLFADYHKAETCCAACKPRFAASYLVAPVGEK